MAVPRAVLCQRFSHLLHDHPARRRTGSLVSRVPDTRAEDRGGYDRARCRRHGGLLLAPA